MSTIHQSINQPTSSVLDSGDLLNFINSHGLDAAILPMKDPTPTVAAAAEALHVEPHQVIKSLVFKVGKEPLMVITSGLARVDRKMLASYLGVGRNKVKFADSDNALEITGYIVGSMPPFGHRTRLRTVLDAATARQSEIYGGGGDIDAMMRLSVEELVRVTEAEIIPISESR